MKLGNVGKRVAMATEPGKLVFGILTLIHWILGWFVMSVVVFLRRNMGERYLSWVNILFGMTAIGLFTGLGNWLLSENGHLSYTIEFAYYGVVGLSVYHRVVIWRKNKRGILWHSYFPGQSWIRIPGLSEEAVAKWVEPAVLLALAQVANHYHDTPLRLWLMIGGFSVLVHEHVSYYMQRQTFLDLRDAMIEQKNWSAVMAGKPARETQGYTIARSNLELLERTPELKDAFQSLPDEMKAMLDKEVAA
jgi:hypothetical protein